MANRWLALTALFLLAGGVPACRTPVHEPSERAAGIDPNDIDLTHEVRELDRQIGELEVWLARYPAKFASDKERHKVQSRWFAAVERAVVLLNVDLDNAELYWRAGSLYRQGHILDIPDAATSAYNVLTRCIVLASEHVECRFELARLLLASDPRFATTAEQLLLEARTLIEPETRPEFEQALASAYLAQGRRGAALRQIDLYLSLRPEDVDAQRFRNDLLFNADAADSRGR